jgi:hypothetical protein
MKISKRFATSINYNIFNRGIHLKINDQKNKIYLIELIKALEYFVQKKKFSDEIDTFITIKEDDVLLKIGTSKLLIPLIMFSTIPKNIIFNVRDAIIYHSLLKVYLNTGLYPKLQVINMGNDTYKVLFLINHVILNMDDIVEIILCNLETV